MIEQKCKELKLKIVPKSDWDDALPKFLEEDGYAITWKNNVLIIEGRAECTYVNRNDKRWLLCRGWVPLWRMSKWSDCFADNWRDLYPNTDFFAIPRSQDDEDEDIKKMFEQNGVATDSFEGF